MLQYLRTERIVPPYQTRGYKLVELVRIYEVGTPTSFLMLDGFKPTQSWYGSALPSVPPCATL